LPSSQFDIDGVITSGDPRYRWREERLELNQYVHLCFYPEHPMAYAITHHEDRRPELREVVWLEVSANVLDFEGVCYTFQMANAKDVRKITGEAAIKDFKLHFIFPSRRSGYHRENIMFEKLKVRNVALKHEILIPHKIGLHHITNFNMIWDKHCGNKISV
jgi:hypothetical protein